MATKGDNSPVGLKTQGIPMETSGTQMPSTEIDPLSIPPLQGFPYVSAPYMTTRLSTPPPYSMPLVPPSYNSLGDYFSDNFGATSLFHNPI